MEWEWSNGVANTIATCKSEHVPLLVLVEPPSGIVHLPNNATDANATNLYARVATNSLHDRLFSDERVQKLMQDAQLRGVRFSADDDENDYKAFATFFKIDHPPPNVFLIAPDTGLVLFRAKGYVSPVQFVNALAKVCVTVSKTVLDIPDDLKVKKKIQHNLNANDHNNIVGDDNTQQFPAIDSNKTTTSTTTFETNSHSNNLSSNNNNENSNVTTETSTTTVKSTTNSRAMQLPGRARLRARLPDGRQIERNFDSKTEFRATRSWLGEECGRPGTQLQISMQFPRRVFSPFDDAKQLDELELTPSASLIVSLSPHAQSQQPSQSQSQSQSSSSSSSWRIPSALGIISSFVRSFVNPQYTATPSATQQQQDQEQQQQQQHNNNNNNNNSNSHSSGLLHNVREGEEPAQAIRITRNDERRSNAIEHNDDDDDDDRQQWLSNGNSTQFGWNPADADDDRAG